MNAPTPPAGALVTSLPVAEIVRSPSNPRKHFNEAALQELASSIRQVGVIQPITVRPAGVDALLAYNV